MELELRITRDPYADLPKQRVRVFGENGGDIGRAPDCYWLLPDPKCYLSGRHCTILFRDGAFWVRDTSRNGVFMNGSEEPLGFGHKAKLAHGHELKFATYKVLVRIKSRGRQPADSVAGDFNAGSTVEPEEQFADVFAATPVAEPLDTPPLEPVLEHENQNLEASSQSMDAVTPQDAPVSYELADSSESMEAALREPEPVQVGESTGEHVQQHGATDQPTDGPVTEGENRPIDERSAQSDAIAVDEQVSSESESEPEPEPGPDPQPTPDEQPAELMATQAIEPALIAAEPARVVHVDRDRLQADGYLPTAKMERLISNQFRHIKRPLIRNALGRGAEPVQNGHLVMVTSSLPGEGKTFSCLNLAFSIAREKDLEVVLIDADVAKQHVSRIFRVNEAPGLLNALSDDLLDVESLILPTDVKGLSILPAGQCAERDIATELIASTRMDEIATLIGRRSAHRIALFDSPPLLLTNEARVLASLMGQILLVVRAGVTPQQAVLEAIGYVDEEKPLGLVLNQSRAQSPGSYYGYGAYGYGGYGTNGDDTPS